MRRSDLKRHHHSGKSSFSLLNYRLIIQLSQIQHGENLIDIGCGYGEFAIELSKNNPTGIVYAIDTFREGIESLRKAIIEEGITNIRSINEDFLNTDQLPQNFFDAAFMINVMHGFYTNNESDRALENLNRILKSDGRVIIAEFRKHPSLTGPPMSERISEKTLSRIFVTRDYQKTHSSNIGFTHYLAIYRKN
ncbi:MAG: class I SAM-dependent methyltransferase [Deltaproteobacteria bacterium]|nr:class I SAM-dependent methyltransferase [Deltaproteobacteria bacterium]